MSKIFKELIILLAACAAIILAIAYFDWFPDKPNLVSLETEERLGEKFMETLEADPSFEISENPLFDSIVNKIGLQLEEALDDPLFNYNYYVVDNNQINAYTLPGGIIVIYTGLLKFCDSAEELAAVMAHELGHAEERHIIDRIVKEVGIELLTGGDAFVLGEISKMVTSSGFDRTQEEKADEFSCELLEKASIEPRTLATLFRKLKEEMGSYNMYYFEIVASHPNFSSRIKNVLSYQPAEDFEAQALDIDWTAVKTELGEEVEEEEADE